MKKLMITFFALTTAIYVAGCYTIIWDPVSEKFPSVQNSYEEYDGYYPDNYYGEYSFFYDRPWWYDITPPAYVSNIYNRDEDPNISILRNLDRGSRTGDFLLNNILNPATRSSGQQTPNVNKSGNITATNTTSAGTTQTTRNNTNNVRNNDGTRNTDTERRRKK